MIHKLQEENKLLRIIQEGLMTRMLHCAAFSESCDAHQVRLLLDGVTSARELTPPINLNKCVTYITLESSGMNRTNKYYWNYSIDFLRKNLANPDAEWGLVSNTSINFDNDIECIAHMMKDCKRLLSDVNVRDVMLKGIRRIQRGYKDE